MAEDKKDQFVWAYFDTFEQADEAARQIVHWDKALADVQLGAVGVIHATDKGKMKTHNYGSHNTRKGAKVGMLLGVLAAFLPAVTLVGGLASGAVLGGVAGRLSKKKLGLTDQEMARVKDELENGKAVLIVACDEYEVVATKAELENQGGRVELHLLSSQELEESAQELSIPQSGDTSETNQG